MSLSSALGEQLRNPTGNSGLVVAWLMRLFNHVPNRAAVDALEVGPDHTVLDLGFGPGQATQGLAKLASNGKVFGIDQSRLMLEQASKRNRQAIKDGRISLSQGVFTALPYADASFDRILAVNVIYFWYDMPGVLKEIRRVLRAKGRLVIYATDKISMQHWAFAGSETHRHFDAAGMRAIFNGSEFAACDITITQIKLTGNTHGLLATVSLP